MINLDDPIHFSEISQWLQCEYKQQLNYVHQIVPRKTSTAMAFGTLGHAALKAHFLKEDPNEHVQKEIQLRYNNDLIRNEITRIAGEAIQVADFVFNRLSVEQSFDIVCVEQPMQIVCDDMLFQGTPDLIISDEYGNWIVDHKFRKTFYPSNSEDVNLQMFLYHRLVEESLGIEITGSRQLQIQPRVPQKPEKIKSGKLSRTNIWCDWDTYQAAVVENGEDVKDYLDMKEKLDKKKWYDINECKSRRSSEEVDKVWNTVILPAARRILRNRKSAEPGIRAMNHFNCKRCDMLEYCVEDLKGGDLDFLLATSFKHKNETSFMELVVELEDDQ